MDIKTNFIRVSILAGALCLVSACTRNVSTTSLSLEFNDWEELRSNDIAYRSRLSSLNTIGAARLEMLVVAATDVKSFKWDRNGRSGSGPTSVTLEDVPVGKTIKVQVVAMYEGTGGLEFYYGSNSIDVKPGEQTVEIRIANVVTSAIKRGAFVGQFIPATGVPPTARIDYVFNPPDGGPSVVVRQAEMFNGWVNLFSLSSSIISYSSTNAVAQALLGDATSLNDSMFSSAQPSRALRISVPDHFVNDSYVVGSFDMHEAGKRIFNVGYFGPGATSSKKVCYETVALEPSAVAINNMYLDQAHTDPLKWIGVLNTASNSSYAKIESLRGPSNSTYTGGDNTSNCALESIGNNEFSDFVKLNHLGLANQDSIVEFRPPFQPVSTSDFVARYVEVSLANAGTEADVKWALMPMPANHLGGATVFYRTVTGDPYSDTDIRKDDGLACEAMRSGAFSPQFQRLDITSAWANRATLTGVSNPNKLQVVVCVKDSSGRYFNSAVVGGYDSSVGGSNVAYELRRVNVANVGQTVVNTSGCVEFRARVFQNGSPHVVPAGRTATFELTNSAPIGFYSAAGCGTGYSLSRSVTIPPGAIESPSFWLQPVFGDTNSAFLLNSASADYVNTYIPDPYMVFMTSPSYNGLVIQTASAMALGRCYPLEVVVLLGSGHGGSSAPINIALSSTTLVGEIFSTSDCSGSGAQLSTNPVVTIPAFQHTQKVFFKPMAIGSDTIVANETASPYETGTSSVISISSSAQSNYRVEPVGQISQFTTTIRCLKVRIEPSNVAGASVPVSIARSVILTAQAGGELHRNSTCTSQVTSKQMTFSTGMRTSRESTYVKIDGSLSYVQLNVNDPTMSPFVFNGPALKINETP